MGSLAPNVSVTDGLEAVWVERGNEGVSALKTSRFAAGKWLTPETIHEGEGFFANWADTPTLTVGADGSRVVHWAQKAGEGTYSYEVRLARKPKGGAWRVLGPAHDDGTASEHGFVSTVPTAEGIRMFWLDGRNTGEPTKGAMTLRTALITDKIEDPAELDTRVCDCCNTAAAGTRSGPVVVYRDRDDAELRDTSIVRATPSGWTAPAPVATDGWKTAGCPVNGPAMVATGANLAVAWFTSAAERPAVKVAWSTDDGATFGAPITLDAGTGDDAPLGRLGMAALRGGEVLISWIAGAGPGAVIRLVRASADGKVGPGYDLAGIDRARASGFPRIGVADDIVHVVWTHVVEPSNREEKKRAVTALRALRLSWSLVGAPVTAPTAADKPPAAASSVKVGDTPNVSARSLSGDETSLKALAGKPVLLNLWATWCRPCREEMPHLEGLRKAHPGLQVVALSVDAVGDEEAVRDYVAAVGLGATIWRDPTGRVAREIGGGTLPITLLLDAKGEVVWRSDAPLTGADDGLTKAIESLAL